MLQSTQAKRKEREWLKQQQAGELDENRIVEGITGENRIYKKRGKKVVKKGVGKEKRKLEGKGG